MQWGKDKAVYEDRKWSLGGGTISDRIVREGLSAIVPLIGSLKVV